MYLHSVSEVHRALSSDESDFYVETISTNNNGNQAFVSHALGPKRTPIEFKLDTESQVNVIPERIFGQLEYSAPLEKPDRHLSAYTDDKLDVIGQCKIKCKYREYHSEIELYVVKTQSSPILGLESCLDVELIRLIYSVDHAD